MRPEILRRHPPSTERRLRDLETSIGHPLPAAYRAFLLDENGGQPVPQTLCRPGADVPTETVNCFLAVDGDVEIDDLVTFVELFRERTPADALPVAYDAFGNPIVLFLRGDRAGQVHLVPGDGGAPDRTVLLGLDWPGFMGAFASVEAGPA